MKLTIAIITNNSEKWVGKVIKRLYSYTMLSEVQFVFVDNMSTDQTVPQIVGLLAKEFIDEERFKFYINTTKKSEQECIDMINKIASSDKCVIIKKNMNIRALDKAIREVIK